MPDGVALLRGGKHPENALAVHRFCAGAGYAASGAQAPLFYRRPVLTAAEERENGGALRLCDYDIAWAGENQAQVLACWQAAVKGGGAE